MALGNYGTLFIKDGKEIMGEEDIIGMFRTNPISTLGFPITKESEEVFNTLYVGDWDFHVGFYKNIFTFGKHGVNDDERNYCLVCKIDNKKVHYFEYDGVKIKVKEYKNTGRYMMTFQLNGNNYRVYFGYGADCLDTMKALKGYFGIKDSEIRFIEKYIR